MQSRMNKPKKPATLGTQDTWRRTQKTTTQKTKKSGVNPGGREGQAVPATYKTPAGLFIYTIKSGKSIGSGRLKKTSTYKV